MALWLVHTALEQVKRFARLLTPALPPLACHSHSQTHTVTCFVFFHTDFHGKAVEVV